MWVEDGEGPQWEGFLLDQMSWTLAVCAWDLSAHPSPRCLATLPPGPEGLSSWEAARWLLRWLRKRTHNLTYCTLLVKPPPARALSRD